MNHEEIAEHLRFHGHDAKLTDDGKVLEIKAKIADRNATLQHRFPDELLQMPRFRLTEVSTYPTLAHVFTSINSDSGWVCVHESDAISVNFEFPQAAYQDSLVRTLVLLERLIGDSAWNRTELLREFRTNWDRFCSSTSNNTNRRLYLANELDSQSFADIRGPLQNRGGGISNHYVGMGRTECNDGKLSKLRNILKWDSRSTTGKALILQLKTLEPAPTKPEDLVNWYVGCVNSLEAGSADELARLRKRTSKEFWLVFTNDSEFGRIWFAVQVVRTSNEKETIPITEVECKNWKVRAVPVRSLHPDSVILRGGGELSLANKSVLLVGCGSVGSELSYRLASSGLGNLHLSDPETFCEDNLYRHTLTLESVGYHKSECLTENLCLKFPWMSVSHDSRKLQEFNAIEELNQFDLIVVAIGSPTVERRFHELVSTPEMSCPVLNVWLEAQGIGGHATLVLPNDTGCLRCAYVDPVDFTRGLSSNMNFLVPNQSFMESRGGCSDLFLPYGSVASTHTAAMAADLGIRYLKREVQISSKVSWKGNARSAFEQGLKTTLRYERFNASLEVLPLFHSECDHCGG